MQHADYVRAIEFYGADIARAARVSLDAPVRACGSWRIADVLWHMGEVHRFWTAMAVSGTTSRAETLRDERPEEMDMIRWYEDGVAQLVSAVS
ncbi:MAG: maleylpyruvate isomerase N-terminal domain-containing protein, partial [Acidimicrobiaceae bacterium]